MPSDPMVQIKAYATAGPYRLSFTATKASHKSGRRAVEYNRMEDAAPKFALGAFFQESEIEGFTTGLMESAIVESIANAGDLAFQLHAPSAAIGDLHGAVMFVGKFSEFQFGVPWGEIQKWTSGIKTNDGVQSMYGTPMWNTVAAGSRLSAAGTSTPVQLPAIPAGYIGRFIFCVPDPDATAGTSPTLNGKLQSAASSAFSSGVVDRGTLAQITPTVNAARCQVFDFDGDVSAVTDTWWRFNVTALGGTSPAFHIIAAGAVMPKITI